MDRTLSHSPRIAVIGSGNVATHLAKAVTRAGYKLSIYNHHYESASRLASAVGTTAVADLDALDADIYIIAIKDDAIASLAASVAGRKGLWLHTSGSVDMKVFDGIVDSYGVLYPMQTFSKDADVDMTEVPFFIEGCNGDVTRAIRELASSLSHKVLEVSSANRVKLHIAAVFACNFTNYMWAQSSDILESIGADFSVMHPLIKATLDKTLTMSPHDGQTGPARRGDVDIIKKHLSMLSGVKHKLYETLSTDIMNEYHHNTTDHQS